jgi:hypothetical protein
MDSQLGLHIGSPTARLAHVSPGQHFAREAASARLSSQ